MPTDIQTVFILLLATIALFASDRLRMDVVALAVGNWLITIAGSSETRLLVLLMLVVAVLSAFMSNTGAVAIFIPVAINLARPADGCRPAAPTFRGDRPLHPGDSLPRGSRAIASRTL